jgi:hypothetical protein
MAITYNYGTTNPVVAPVATATAVSVGDLCAIVGGNVVPAGSFTWDTDLATTQENFAEAFLGASGQFKKADVSTVYGNSVANEIRIDCSGIYEATYTGVALVVGDFVGPANSGNNLVSQSLVKVATKALAIGSVVEANSGTGVVKFQLLSTLNSVAR